MRNNVHSRSFLFQWQLLYAASNPGQRKDKWHVDGVDWTRERLSFWGTDYSVTLEVHQLKHQRGGKIDWQLMVVIESWWGPDRQKAIRSSTWNKIMSGKADQILAWLKRQDVEQRNFEETGPTVRTG
jgi:hypothetical protein